MPAFDRFRLALRFLTILPIKPKANVPAGTGLLTYARDFPLAGAFIGCLPGGVYWLASAIWAGLVPSLLAVTAGLIVTGALHEDGLADTADGFCGGWTRDQRLAIMKDSRLGTYGVLALGLGLALKICALAALSPMTAFFALIAVHAGARFVPVLVLATENYAGDAATAKTIYSSTRLARQEVQYALVCAALAMLPMFYLKPLPSVLGIVLGGMMSWALMLYSKKAIGGYCGDVLGAIEQLFEIGCLLGLASMPGVGATM